MFLSLIFFFINQQDKAIIMLFKLKWKKTNGQKNLFKKAKFSIGKT